MKKFSIIVLLASFGLFLVNVNSGCAPKEKPKPQDTTNNDTTPDPPVRVNGFRLGVDPAFAIDISAPETFGVYNTTQDRTYIQVKGNDPNKSENEQDVLFTLEFDTLGLGTRTTLNGNAVIQVGIGTGIFLQEWSSNGGSASITITKYDPVGGIIKGTFSGTLKMSSSSAQLQGGYFEVERRDDE